VFTVRNSKKSAILAAMIIIAACANVLAAVDGSDLLRSIQTTSAAAVVAQYPTESRELTIDLIFYRWACGKYGADTGIENLDKTISALVSAQGSDQTIKWAAAEFSQKESSPPPEGNQTAESLSDAKQLLESAVQRSSTYPTRSIEQLISCTALLSEINAKLSWAFVTEKLAERQLYAVRRYREARANYERAIPILSAYGLRALAANAFNDLGLLESEMGRYSSAHQNYLNSGNEWRALGRGDKAGEQYVSAGEMLIKDGKITTGLSTVRTGLELARGYADAKKSYESLVKLLIRAAQLYESTADRESQRMLLDEAETAAKNSGNSLLLADVMSKQAIMWQAMNLEPRVRERNSAREKVLSALAQSGSDAAAKLTLSTPAAEQMPLLATAEQGAEAYRLLGKYQQGIEILKKVAMFYQALGKEDDRIRVLRALAANYDGANQRQEALSTRILAAESAKNIDKPFLAVEILREIEQSALDARDTGTAVEALRESVQVMDAAGNRLALADLLEARGLLLDRIGQTAEAINDLKKAAAIYLAEIGEPWTQTRVLEKLALMQENSGDIRGAIDALSSAATRIEQWAADEGVDPDADPGHTGILKRIYFKLVPMLIREGRKDEAIQAMNRARNRPWYMELRSNIGALTTPLAKEVLKSTEGQINGSSGQTGTARKIASGWQAVLTQVPQFSRMARTGMDNISYGAIDAADIYEVRDKLPQDLAIVSYHLTGSTAIVLIATKRTINCWELPADREHIRTAARAFRAAIREYENKASLGIPVAPVKSWTDPGVFRIVSPLLDISTCLIDPIRAELAQVKTIAFALPDELSGIPFHALPRDIGGSYNFLIQSYGITYISPGGLRKLTDTHTGSLNPKTCRVGIFYDSSGELPGAIREKNLIKAIYKNSTAYTGYAATAEQFIAAASSCGILHIAAHNQADPNPSKFSIKLAKSVGDRFTVGLDSMLRISKNPNLQLAVLSACDTISTADIEAFGAAYTAQVFALAGFPSLIGGLWKISDDASVSLMSTFYRTLALNGGRRAEAIRRAQLSMLQSSDGRYANPFYWAAFALYGDPR